MNSKFEYISISINSETLNQSKKVLRIVLWRIVYLNVDQTNDHTNEEKSLKGLNTKNKDDLKI